MNHHMENDTQKRRRLLLQETRRLYEEHQSNPAIHPRYRASYHHIYKENETTNKSSLKIRILLSIVCFVCYLLVDYGNIVTAHFDDSLIHEMISSQMQLYKISEVLNHYEQTGTFR